jgi:D-amino-acid dehydrogenase
LSRSVAVVGAGLAGVTTAYELAALGWRVQVFERCASVAEQASFAGSALLAPFLPGLVDANPPAPPAFRLRRWRAARRPSDAPRQLCVLSQLGLTRATQLRHELGLDDESGSGLLVALADARRVEAVQSHLGDWQALGLQVQLIEAGEARLREPGLDSQAPFAAALAVAQGGTGNLRLFAQQLRLQAQRLGAEFRFHTTVRRLHTDSTGITLRHEHTPPTERPTRSAERDAGDTQPQALGTQEQRFDAVVLCSGLDALELLDKRLQLHAHHEASITAPLRQLEAHPDLGPKAAWADLAAGIAITRIGQRVRVSGGATISAPGRKHTPDFEALHRTLQHWFPGSVLHQQAQQRSSRRAAAPDGLPLIGATTQPGLWLNLTLGGQGWGSACGSALVLAQMIAGQPSSTDISGLSPQRLA